MRNSKLIVSAAVAISAIVGVGAASAADLAARPYTKAAPMMVAMYDWSGLYIGGNGGWGSARDCWDLQRFPPDTVAIGDEGCHNATGAVAGGQVGYRWQSSAWVFGLEAQGDWANLNGSNISTFVDFTGVQNHSKVDAFGLFTGQVGYAWNNVLLYVKGGATVTHDRYDGSFTVGGFQPFDTARETRWGGVVGAGLEYGFSPNWSVAVEYDHMFMGNRNITTAGVGAFAFQGSERVDNIRQDVDLVTVRLNYRFGGPVVARY
jgi:outer membrane immunogenic protein